MPTQFTSLAGCKKKAQLVQAGLVNSIAHLFQSSLTPTPSTTLADLTAAEADFDSYAAITITAFTGPYLAPTDGYFILSPALNWVYTNTGPGVGNLIGGYYLVTAAGVLMDVVIFDQPIPMQVNDQVVAYEANELYATS